MKRLLLVRSLTAPDCARLAREFGYLGLPLSEHELLGMVGEGKLARRMSLVAEVQTHILALVGLISVTLPDQRQIPDCASRLAQLTHLLVPARYRRQGVASRLLDELEKQAVGHVGWLVARPDREVLAEACRELLNKRGYALRALGDADSGMSEVQADYGTHSVHCIAKRL